MTFRLHFWGTRGSIATPGPSTVRYGGNTACVEVRGPSGELVVFDAGTGMRELGNRLQQERLDGEPLLVHLLISHLHWDHIQGLPFFRPAFDPRTQLTIYGPSQGKKPLKDLLGLGMDDPFFPVDLDGLPAQLIVNELRDGALAIGSLHVRTVQVHHPSPCLAFRVEAARRSIVYATDTEDAFTGRENPVNELARGADLLIHDAQYLDQDRKAGWGHSTVEAAIEVAAVAGVRTLVLYHHDPDRSDDELDAIGLLSNAIVAERAVKLRVIVAREGLELEV